MRIYRRRGLALAPLLRAYRDAGPPPAEALAQLPGWGPRFHAVQTAAGRLLREAFVDEAPEADFRTALIEFYTACVTPALHAAALERRAGVLRHALGHLLRGRDPLPRKLARCLAPDGPYYVAGLGPAFWSALTQALDPRRHPAWLPSVTAGLRRLSLPCPEPGQECGEAYATLLQAYARLQSFEPSLSALHLDHFLGLVARMRGRDLFAGGRPGPDVTGFSVAFLRALLNQERARLPLRRRLKGRGLALRQARQDLESALAAGDGRRLGDTLAVADPAGARRARVRWKRDAETLTAWVSRLWEAEDLFEILQDFWSCDPVAGAGLWLPAAVLHLRDPRRFFPWDDLTRQGYAAFDDAADPGGPPAEGYRLFTEGLAALREQVRCHPFEIPALLAAVRAAATAESESAAPAAAGFGGFCADSFRFLAELGQSNRRAWMDAERERYRFAVREPLIELCRTLAHRYVEPVLRRHYGWDIETAPRNGRALTSIAKNDYGRSVPYQTDLWITFYRRLSGQLPAGKRDAVQFFVRLNETGLRYGLRLGRVERFRHNVGRHADELFRALAERGAFAGCRFGDEADPTGADSRTRGADAAPLTGPAHLRAWAEGRAPVAFKELPPADPLLTSDDLAGDILLTFDRLLPAFAFAVEPEPLAAPGHRAAVCRPADVYTESDFRRQTFLGHAWLARARELLTLKKQLILQGVPGTGKTHVARCLARLLAGNRPDAVRLVQFHPAFSYEEFVEGIKVRSVEVDGKHEVTYPVEDGLLAAFAAEAARRPAEPHVLVIDEINRGNLPRIFGELLYLLEYRGQSLQLPYSKRPFQLPANLYLIGTMNGADRSVALVDQALRRRFSFLDMAPDAAVLASWFGDQPPAGGEEFAGGVVRLFDRLNDQLKTDLGPAYQIGHSYFMVPGLDEPRLRVVWAHHVQPLLEEYFAGHPARLEVYEFDTLWKGERRESTARKRRKARPARQ